MSLEAFLRSSPQKGSPSNQDSFVEGLCRSVDSGGMYFTIPSWDSGMHVFGPAPWPMSRIELASGHDHPETVPQNGARVLVLFLGGGVDRPWVLGWWP